MVLFSPKLKLRIEGNTVVQGERVKAVSYVFVMCVWL